MHIGNGETEIKIKKIIRVTGTGAVVSNLLQVRGAIRVIDQHAVITSITTLANATNVYATAYDGTNSVNLTSDGVTLSGFSVGSVFLKDQVAAQTYTALNADEVRVSEVVDLKKAGRPFTVVQKNGADTFLRLHLTTTDTPVDFEVEVTFCYCKLSSDSSLVFL